MQNALALTLLASLLTLVAGSAQERQPAPAEPPAAPTEERTAAYDVRDLCARLALQTSDPDGAAQARREALDEIVVLLRENLAPPALEGKVAALGDGMLVVLGTDEIHRLVARFLTDLRRYSGTLYDLQFQQVTLSAEQAAELGIGEETQFLHDGPDALLAALDELAARDESVELVRPPRVLVHNNQWTRIDTIERIPYVAGHVRYESVEPTGRPLVDPLVEHFEVGTRIECRAIGTHDGKYASIQLSAEFKGVERPLEARTDELGVSCAPTVTTRSFETNVIVPHGTTVVLPAATVDGRTTVLLMQVARVDPEPR